MAMQPEHDDDADDSAFGSGGSEPKVRDLRSAPPEPDKPTEFHKTVAQIALKYIGAASDKRHLAVLAKAQVVACRAVRRVLLRCEVSTRQPIEFTPDEVLALVMEEDKADERSKGA